MTTLTEMIELILAFIVPTCVALIGLAVREYFMPMDMDSGAKALGIVMIADIAGMIGLIAEIGGLI